MGQGDVPTSPGGPLRRRREKRQLGQLADKSDREVSPTAAKGHVRLIEDQAAATDAATDANEEREGKELELKGPETSPSVENRPGGFHVRPKPIDQPLHQA